MISMLLKILSYKAEGDRRTQNPETAPKPVTEIGRAQSTCSRRSARVLGDGQASQRCHDLREAGAPSATSHFRAFDAAVVVKCECCGASPTVLTPFTQLRARAIVVRWLSTSVARAATLSPSGLGYAITANSLSRLIR